MQKSLDFHDRWCLELLSGRIGYWCPVVGLGPCAKHRKSNNNIQTTKSLIPSFPAVQLGEVKRSSSASRNNSCSCLAPFPEPPLEPLELRPRADSLLEPPLKTLFVN